MRLARAWRVVVAVGVVATALAFTPGITSAQTPSDPTHRAPDEAVRAPRVGNEFLVAFTPASDADRRDAAAQAVIDKAAAKVGIHAGIVRRVATGAALVKTEQPLDDVKASAFLDALAGDPSVAFAEPDEIVQPTSTPNDPRYPEQWHYYEPAGGISLPTALDKAPNHGGGVTVAVIDTGFAPHPDLDGNVTGGYDFISDPATAGDGDARDPNPNDEGDWTPVPICPDERPGSSSWHGTHVAGTIAAVTNNGVGVAGVAPGAKVEALRTLGHCGGTDDDIIDAIVWAAGGSLSPGVQPTTKNPNPAKVINMSLGGPGPCLPGSAYQKAINMAVGRGTTVVVAAGNENIDSRRVSPSSCANVINVAATDRAGKKAPYSNFGTLVDVCAPGGNTRTGLADGVLSTYNSGKTTQGLPDYRFLQGTSMAAPHVAGTVALMLGEAPAMTPAQVEARLKATGRVTRGTCLSGRKIIDAGAAVATLPCTTTTTGNVTGPVVVASGQHACFVSATVSGAITVNPGGELTVTNSRVDGAITSNGARAVDLCSDVIGPSPSGPALSVTNTAGAVHVGDPATGCAGNGITGAVNLTANTEGLVFGSNRVQGSETVDANQGGPVLLQANVIAGTLSCVGNNPPPTNNGNANTAGSKAFQCSGL